MTSNVERRMSSVEQLAPNERTRAALKESNMKRARRGRTTDRTTDYGPRTTDYGLRTTDFS